jgi:CHAD domain-containing protein
MGRNNDLPTAPVSTSFILTEAGADEIRAVLGATGIDLATRRDDRRVVLDTFDGRLHGSGLRLELREGHRRELVVVTTSDSPPASVSWDGPPPVLSTDLPTGPFGARIAAAIGERALLPVLEIHATRRDAVRNDRRGRPVVRVALHDNVRVVAPAGHDVASTVVEVATSAGHDASDDRVIRALRDLGSLREGDLVDAVLSATGHSLGGHTSSPSVPMQPSDDALAAFSGVLRNLLSTIDDNVPGTLAELDTEFLHDLRVAIRRTRSVLTEAKGVLPDKLRAQYRQGFRELAAATGRARDLDVYVLGWNDAVGQVGLDDPDALAPILEQLEADRRVAHRDVAEALQGDTTRELLDSWREWLDGDAVEPSDAGSIGPYIAERIRKAQSGLLRDGRSITPESPAERLHDLRKDAKKLRYLLECFEGVLPTKSRKRFVGQLKALQDNLGQHQDAQVQVEELRSIAHVLNDGDSIGTDTLLAMGRLIDHLERVRERERDAFAQRFAAYDSKANRALLRAMLAKAAGS